MLPSWFHMYRGEETVSTLTYKGEINPASRGETRGIPLVPRAYGNLINQDWQLRATSCCLRSWGADICGVANVCSVLRLWCVHDPGCTRSFQPSFPPCFEFRSVQAPNCLHIWAAWRSAPPDGSNTLNDFLLLFLRVWSLKSAFQNEKRLKCLGFVFQQHLDSDLCLLVWV